MARYKISFWSASSNETRVVDFVIAKTLAGALEAGSFGETTQPWYSEIKTTTDGLSGCKERSRNGEVVARYTAEEVEEYDDRETIPVLGFHTKKSQETKETDEGVVVIEKKTFTREAGTDRFGNRLGTSAAAINAVITKEPQTAEQLAAKAGVSVARIGTHMPCPIKRGFVVKEGKTYREV